MENKMKVTCWKCEQYGNVSIKLLLPPPPQHVFSINSTVSISIFSLPRSLFLFWQINSKKNEAL